MITINKEMLGIAKEVIRENELKNIKISFKKAKRGSARYRTRSITIPLWAILRTKEFALYYTVHEVCHFVMMDKYNVRGHGDKFKQIETSILEKYNIKPIYDRAYPRYLIDLQGNKLCDKYGHKS